MTLLIYWVCWCKLYRVLLIVKSHLPWLTVIHHQWSHWGQRSIIVAFSTAESKYVVVAQCCSQLLWIKKHLEDFCVLNNTVPIICDNSKEICIHPGVPPRRHTAYLTSRRSYTNLLAFIFHIGTKSSAELELFTIMSIRKPFYKM